MLRPTKTGPICYNETVTAAIYREKLSNNCVMRDELQHGYFQQDNATAAHTVRAI